MLLTKDVHLGASTEDPPLWCTAIQKLSPHDVTEQEIIRQCINSLLWEILLTDYWASQYSIVEESLEPPKWCISWVNCLVAICLSVLCSSKMSMNRINTFCYHNNMGHFLSPSLGEGLEYAWSDGMLTLRRQWGVHELSIFWLTLLNINNMLARSRN